MRIFVVGTEAFDAAPVRDLMKAPIDEGGYGQDWGIQERTVL